VVRVVFGDNAVAVFGGGGKVLKFVVLRSGVDDEGRVEAFEDVGIGLEGPRWVCG
jgi:hypothetical protein